MNLILNSDTTNLTLHKLQDSLYNEFRRLFPEMNVETVSAEINKEKYLLCNILFICINEYSFDV